MSMFDKSVLKSSSADENLGQEIKRKLKSFAESEQRQWDVSHLFPSIIPKALRAVARFCNGAMKKPLLGSLCLPLPLFYADPDFSKHKGVNWSCLWSWPSEDLMKTSDLGPTTYTFSLRCQQCAYSDWCLSARPAWTAQEIAMGCWNQKKPKKKTLNISFTNTFQRGSNGMAQSAYCTRPYKTPATPNITTAHAPPGRRRKGKRGIRNTTVLVFLPPFFRLFSQKKTSYMPFEEIDRDNLPSSETTQVKMFF